VIKKPFDFWSGKVSGNGQTSFFTQAILSAILNEFIADI